MTDLILPTTTFTSTDEAARETRPAADLQLGDWVAADQLLNEAGDTIAAPVEVLSVHPKNDSLYGPSHLVVFRLPDGDLITHNFTNADDDLQLATKAELEEAKQEGRRQLIASQLHQLARLYAEGKMPLPRHSLQIHTSSVDMEQLAKIADDLGSKVEHSYNNRYEVVWPAGHLSFQDGVHIEWSATKPEDPKPEPADDDQAEQADPDHGRTTAVADAKPDTLVVPVGRTAKAANGARR